MAKSSSAAAGLYSARAFSLGCAAALLAANLLFAQPRAASAPPPAATPVITAPASPAAAASPAEKPLTSPQEADELFHQMTSILRFVSDDTRLPIRHPVSHKLVGRDEVERNTKQRVEKDKDAQRLEHAAVVLKKFGLLPRDFDLRTYLVELMKEQVAGFYNTEDQTMYLLNWIPPQEQLPIMAHELTHALQDQDVGLESWLRDDKKESANAAKPNATEKPAGANAEKRYLGDDPTKFDAAAADAHVAEDEEEAAREALAEGQGMVVMIDYLLKDIGRNALDSPNIVEEVKESMRGGGDYPMFNHAPLYLQESIAFPYSYGLDFVRALLFQGGPKLAYDGALHHPPDDTREIMEPKAYLSGEKQQPLLFPDLRNILGKNYESYDAGSIGEFDVRVLLKQFSGDKIADQLSRGWRGGGYWAFGIGGTVTTAQPGADATGAIALLYLSRWATPEQAQQFAAQYAHSLAKRYKFASLQQPDGSSDTTRWITEEGPVLIESRGGFTMALESFDPVTLEKIREAVWDFEKPGAAVPAPVR